MVPTPTLSLPESYSTLPVKTIKVSHYPAESKTPTPIIIVTLYRPKSYNAFNFEMQAEMEK
jgi:enoyl-CoA hydratase/carnithine racemase